VCAPQGALSQAGEGLTGNEQMGRAAKACL